MSQYQSMGPLFDKRGSWSKYKQPHECSICGQVVKKHPRPRENVMVVDGHNRQDTGLYCSGSGKVVGQIDITITSANELPRQLPEVPREIHDICQNRHGGNAESAAAFKSIKDRLTQRETLVLSVIQGCRGEGATCDEIAQTLNTTPNAISGRCTSLKIKGLIKKNGTRLTRSGNPAAVLIAT